MADPVVFFGSGPVAAQALELLARHTAIEAVITKPQPPHHKETFPVLKTCADLKIGNVHTASNKRELSELFANQEFQSRTGVVIDFGIIIDQDVIDSFELGIVNSHFSLLPKWRGADPISYAILNGDQETGVSLMLIVEKLDEGPLLAQQAIPISPQTDIITLTAELIALSDQLLQTHLPAYLAGDLKPYPQPEDGVSYSKKLTKDMGALNFDKPAAELERQVRAFVTWPKSRANIGGMNVIITAAHVVPGSGMPGLLWLDGRQFGFYTADGILVVDQLIPAGKKAMSAADFLLGYKLV